MPPLHRGRRNDADAAAPQGQRRCSRCSRRSCAHVPAPARRCRRRRCSFRSARSTIRATSGRLGIGRIRRGRMAPAQEVAVLREPARRRRRFRSRAKVGADLQVRRDSSASPVESASARRHRARHRRRRTVDRHDARGASMRPKRCRRSSVDEPTLVDVFPGEHVAARRPRRQVRDVAQPPRSTDEASC